MTGYAALTREVSAGTLTLELKSVNSRFLDLQFRMNDDLRALEPGMREAIMAKVTRGKVECRLSFGRKVSTGANQALNTGILANLASMQSEVTKLFEQASPLSVHELLRWPGVLEEANIGQDKLQEDVAGLLRDTLAAFIDSREREGAAMQAAIEQRITDMEAIVQRVTPLIPQVIAQFQQKATDRMREALGLVAPEGTTTTISHDEALERIRQEVTLYGIRIDVAEELTRLGAHLKETRHILKKGGQVGKRLDFMMQELNRESNTIGSKASIKDVADAAMDLKLLIEQMREQVQNLE